MRRGFTMIELIFVIVILGILAAVAIPKLMATRDDAKIAAMSQQIQSAVQEIPQYVAARGDVDDLTKMSQVLAQLKNQGKLKASCTSAIGGNCEIIQTENPNVASGVEDCIKIDVNNTTLVVTHESGTGTICKGVQDRIAEGNFTIAGQGVKF